jgi:hypothetical protein
MPAKINESSLPAPGFQARLREVMTRAEALAAEIDALHHDMSVAGNESVRRTAFRCAAAVESVRQAAAALRDTSANAERITTATAPRTCAVPWGACREHGNTLVSSGGKSWCRNAGCRQSWDYDRGGLPCTDPARWHITDRHAGTILVCDGHAVAARTSLDGARVVPLAAFRKGRA